MTTIETLMTTTADAGRVEKVNAAIPEIFRCPDFYQISRYRWRATIDDTKIGAVIATRTWRYDNYGLSTADFYRLIEAQSAGRIDVAVVVAACVSRDYIHSYTTHREAGGLHQILKGVKPRQSEFGAFWVLRPDLTPLGSGATSHDGDDWSS